MTFKEYERNIDDVAQEECMKLWNEKQKLKKNKRKERINKIKEILGGMTQ